MSRNFQAVRVFVSYSHRDERFLKQLRAHTATLRQNGYIEAWDDAQILPGDNWDEKITQALEAADIILFLLSPDFFESTYITSRERARALQRHDEGTALVVPILVRPVEFSVDRITKLQCLPAGKIAVTECVSEDQAFRNITSELLRLIQRHRGNGPVEEAEDGPEADRITFPVRTLVVYSLEDQNEFTRLRRHLSPLASEGLIHLSDNHRLTLDRTTSGRTLRQVRESDLVLLLVSANFLADEQYFTVLVREALDRLRDGMTYVLPIIVGECPWQGTILGELEVLPDRNASIASSPDPEAECSRIADAVCRIVQMMASG